MRKAISLDELDLDAQTFKQMMSNLARDIMCSRDELMSADDPVAFLQDEWQSIISMRDRYREKLATIEADLARIVELLPASKRERYIELQLREWTRVANDAQSFELADLRRSFTGAEVRAQGTIKRLLKLKNRFQELLELVRDQLLWLSVRAGELGVALDEQTELAAQRRNIMLGETAKEVEALPDWRTREFVTQKEAAAIIKRSVRTIYNYLEKGILKATKGGQRRVLVSSLKVVRGENK